MANSEFGNVSPIYSYTFSAMIPSGSETEGSYIGTTSPQKFYLCNSEVIAIKRITSGGTVGYPIIEEVIPSPKGLTYSGSAIRLRSTSNTDTSVYQLLWVNKSDPKKWGN